MWDVNEPARVVFEQACQGLIWTMWDVNTNRWSQLKTYLKVWSELCGMWTKSYICALRAIKKVWSELCGMWTGRQILSRRRNGDFARLIWTMWDVNHYKPFVNIDHESVWSELCGMWTRSTEAENRVRQTFDLNYVGCEHTSRRQKQKSLWTVS